MPVDVQSVIDQVFQRLPPPRHIFDSTPTSRPRRDANRLAFFLLLKRGGLNQAWGKHWLECPQEIFSAVNDLLGHGVVRLLDLALHQCFG